MTPQSRIRLARRQSTLSQTQLAKVVGVQRSAVSQWEAVQGKRPSMAHLCDIAMATGVHVEWLATGRGQMSLSREQVYASIAAAHGCMVDDPLELRLLDAFRAGAAQAQVLVVEMAEQLAVQRIGRHRPDQQRALRAPVEETRSLLSLLNLGETA